MLRRIDYNVFTIKETNLAKHIPINFMEQHDVNLCVQKRLKLLANMQNLF